MPRQDLTPTPQALGFLGNIGNTIGRGLTSFGSFLSNVTPQPFNGRVVSPLPQQNQPPYNPTNISTTGGLPALNTNSTQPQKPDIAALGQPNTFPAANANTASQAQPNAPQRNASVSPQAGIQVNPQPNSPQSTSQTPIQDIFSQFQNPQSQQYLQQQIDTYQRLGALQQQLAQANVPSGLEVQQQNLANQLQLDISNLNPQQFLKDNPALQANGITEGGLQREVAQEQVPIEQSLSQAIISKSALANVRTNQAAALGAQAQGLTSQADIANQIRQLTQFGGLPSDVVNTILQRTLFPQYNVTTDISGQPIAYNVYNPSQSMALGVGGSGQFGGFGGLNQANSGFNGVNSVAPNVVNGNSVAGYNLSTYATDPQYAQKVGSIYSSLPQFSSPQQITSYIQSVAPNSPITGDMIMASSTKYGVDPNLLVAQAQEESQFGTAGAARSTFNPGNVGNTGSATQNMGNWQTGLDAQAQNLAVRHQSNQNSQNRPATINIAGLPVQLNYMQDGTPYIAQSKIDSRIEPYVESIAPSLGIQVLNDQQFGKIQNIDVTNQALDQLGTLIPQMLGTGFLGRLQGLSLNQAGSALQSDPRWQDFNIARTTALNSIQALASGEGSGFRLTQGEIDTATANLPTITDNQESAQEKLIKMKALLQNWTNEILPNNVSQQQPQGTSGSANDPLGIFQ